MAQSDLPSRLALILVAGLTLTATATSQRWRDERIREVGLEFRAPHYLERIPQRLGATFGYTRARLEPKKKQDYVDGRLKWTVLVLEFEPAAGEEGGEAGEAEDPKKAARAALEKLAGRPAKTPKSFRAWLDLSKDVEIVLEGKERRGRSGKLDHRHWVWRTGKVYGEAAVYDLNGREVALVIWMPLPFELGKKPPSKPTARWTKMINSILRSGRAVATETEDAVADADDRRRDEHADTEARRRALAAAKKNIAGLKGWDYFTTPHYIVLYSWQERTSHARNASRNAARHYSSRLERMRELYEKHYPLDPTTARAVLPDPGAIPVPKSTTPVTGKPAEKPGDAEAAEDPSAGNTAAEKQSGPPYSVLRFCATEAQFQKYGQSPRGVVGWFSPTSKELVVFLGGDERMGKGATESVVYHEGWHQYANFYFDNPGRKKRDALHRWFDEGHGDYFGSYRIARGKWRYAGSAMRGKTIERLVDLERVPSLKKLVEWPRAQFYGRNASSNYAVAWALVDFLRRGELLRRHYKPRYAEILDDYKNVMLVHGDSKLATDTAFREFTAEDWSDLQAGWRAWVESGHFRDG